jgi:hypothetical protein
MVFQRGLETLSVFCGHVRIGFVYAEQLIAGACAIEQAKGTKLFHVVTSNFDGYIFQETYFLYDAVRCSLAVVLLIINGKIYLSTGEKH